MKEERTPITIPNHHKEPLPAWVNEEPESWARRFYGQNWHGEQMFVEVTPNRTRFTHGDCGWETYEFKTPDGEHVNYKLFESTARFLAENSSNIGLLTAFAEAKLWPINTILSREEYLFLAMAFALGLELVAADKSVKENRKQGRARSRPV